MERVLEWWNNLGGNPLLRIIRQGELVTKHFNQFKKVSSLTNDDIQKIYEMENKKRIKFVCSKCGSDHILMDAFAIWDVDLQEWVLNSTHEQTYCEGECGGECDVEEVEIKDGEILIPVN